MRAALVGTGEVATRAGRQLVETDGLSELVVIGRNARAAEQLAEAYGPSARTGTLDDLAAVDAVALAVSDDAVAELVDRCIAAGRPTATVFTTSRAARLLAERGPAAVAAGVPVVAGAGLAPGLADVLAVHAAALFDQVEDVRVALTGWAGAACLASMRVLTDEPARVLVNGTWEVPARSDEEQVWFPDPIAARDCRLVNGAVGLLADAFPEAGRCSLHVAPPRTRRLPGRRIGDDGQWGGVRVEVWGRSGAAPGEYDVVVYGVVDRPAVAAGAVLAVATAQLGGLAGGRIDRPGVAGLGELVTPVPFLAELAHRGVRAAAFEGAPVR